MPRARLRLVCLEDRTVPATLDIASRVLTYTSDFGALDASVANGRFVFAAGPVNSGVAITLGPGAAAAGWTSANGTATGPVAGVTAVDIGVAPGEVLSSLAFHDFVAPLTRLTASVTAAGIAVTTGTSSGDAGGPGITIPGDVTFTGFSSVNVGRPIAAGGTVTFSTAGSANPLLVTIGQPVSGAVFHILGGTGNDQVHIRFTDRDRPAAALPDGLTFDGGGGVNSLTLGDPFSLTGHAYAADGSSASRDGTVIHYANVQQVTLLGTDGPDTFTVTPSAATEFEVGGGAGVDTLTVRAAPGAVGYQTTHSATGLAGTAAVSGQQLVRFQDVEALSPAAPLLAAVTSPAAGYLSGGAVRLTYVLTNPGRAAVTGVSITDRPPGGGANPFTAESWTARPSPGTTVSAAGGTGAVALTVDLAPGGTVTVDGTAQVVPQTSSFDYALTASLKPGSDRPTAAATIHLPLMSTLRPPVPPAVLYAVAAGPGGAPRVDVYNADGTLRFRFLAYDASFTGGVSVATGDVTGDGVEDVITGPGPGGGPDVRVFDGATGALVREFLAYDAGFRGGVHVAAGYITGDEHADIVTGAGPGGGPQVNVFDGGTGAPAGSFMAYDPGFRGGVFVAVGDVPAQLFHPYVSFPRFFPPALPRFSDDVPIRFVRFEADGVDDIVTGAGPGGAPHVKVFDGLRLGRAGVATPVRGAIGSFLAYDLSFTGGVSVATGDVNGDGFVDVITGPGRGGGPHVKAFTGPGDGDGGQAVSDFFPFDSAFRGGVAVAAADLNGDGVADLIVGAGPGAVGPPVQVHNGATGAILAAPAFDPTFLGGVFVG